MKIQLLGNLGLNSMFSTHTDTVRMYVNDFDKNGTVEQIISYTTNQGEFPFVQRMDLLTQIPSLRKKYQNFNSYAGQSVQDIFGEELLAEGLVFEVNELRSGILWNDGNTSFEFQALPTEAQISPIFSILINHFDVDNYKDIVVGGNQYLAKPQIGINGASKGLLLSGSTQGKYTALSIKQSGLNIDGQIREIIDLSSIENKKILFARNSETPKLYFYDN